MSSVFTVGQLVEFRTGLRSRWAAGRIVEIGHHLYKIRAALTSKLVTIKLGGEGRSGKVRPLTEETAQPSTAALPPITPALRVVRIDRSGLVAQPRPRARFRCPIYLAYVRARPCCSCGAPGPSDPHHAGPRGVGQTADDCSAVPLCRPCHRAVTDTNALPGLTREYSKLRLLEAQVQLLSEWVAGAEDADDRSVAVHVLKGVAS